ncbi:hypothetical protein B296_00021021, partial [Ensete ventricosum]
ARRQPPLRPTPPPLLAVGLAGGGRLLRATTPCGRPAIGPLCERRTVSGCTRGRLPHLRTSCSRSCPQVPPLRTAAPASDVGLPYGLLPLEIVYPCIPDSNGENDGGQASSSLAVSTRWISIAKLLQSDLATLAQRKGGE